MKTKKLLTYCLLALLFTFGVACTSGSDSKETENDELETIDPADLEGNDFLITITTSYGEMKAVLHDKTPQHKENFLKLAREGYFDSLMFHRVMERFMIQGGDPNSRNAAPGDRLGFGGPGFQVPNEVREEYFHKKGAIAGAQNGNPEKASNGSQFYIVHGQVYSEDLAGFNQVKLSQAMGIMQRDFPNDPILTELTKIFQDEGQLKYFARVAELNEEITEKTGIEFMFSESRKKAYSTIGGASHLDGDYTVFGQVIGGLDVLDQIAGVQVGSENRPVEDVRMFITIEEMPKAEIARTFNYTYFK